MTLTHLKEREPINKCHSIKAKEKLSKAEEQTMG